MSAGYSHADEGIRTYSVHAVLWLVCEGAVYYLWYGWLTGQYTPFVSEQRPHIATLHRCQVLHADTLQECIDEQARHNWQGEWWMFNVLTVLCGGAMVALIKIIVLTECADQLVRAGVYQHMVTTHLLFHLLVWQLSIIHYCSVRNMIGTGQYVMTASDVRFSMCLLTAGALAVRVAVYVLEECLSEKDAVTAPAISSTYSLDLPTLLYICIGIHTVLTVVWQQYTAQYALQPAEISLWQQLQCDWWSEQPYDVCITRAQLQQNVQYWKRACDNLSCPTLVAWSLLIGSDWMCTQIVSSHWPAAADSTTCFLHGCSTS